MYLFLRSLEGSQKSKRILSYRGKLIFLFHLQKMFYIENCMKIKYSILFTGI